MGRPHGAEQEGRGVIDEEAQPATKWPNMIRATVDGDRVIISDNSPLTGWVVCLRLDTPKELAGAINMAIDAAVAEQRELDARVADHACELVFGDANHTYRDYPEEMARHIAAIIRRGLVT